MTTVIKSMLFSSIIIIIFTLAIIINISGFFSSSDEKIITKIYLITNSAAFFIAAFSLFSNIISTSISDSNSRKNLTYRLYLDILQDAKFRGCSNYLKDEFKHSPLYERWNNDPKSADDEEIVVNIYNRDDDGIETALKIRMPLKECIGTVSHWYDAVGMLAAAGAIDLGMFLAFTVGSPVGIWQVIKEGTAHKADERAKILSELPISVPLKEIRYQGGYAYLAQSARGHIEPYYVKLSGSRPQTDR